MCSVFHQDNECEYACEIKFADTDFHTQLINTQVQIQTHSHRVNAKVKLGIGIDFIHVFYNYKVSFRKIKATKKSFNRQLARVL